MTFAEVAVDRPSRWYFVLLDIHYAIPDITTIIFLLKRNVMRTVNFLVFNRLDSMSKRRWIQGLVVL